MTHKAKPKLFRILVKPKLVRPTRLEEKSAPLDPLAWNNFSELPKRRKLKQLSGLVICPMADALPDPHWPDYQVNLRLIRWALVLDGNIIYGANTLSAVEKWRDHVKSILDKSRR